MSTIQQHPDYHEGFYDAQDGHPLHLGSSREYREGWLSFHECKSLVSTGLRGSVRSELSWWEEQV